MAVLEQVITDQYAIYNGDSAEMLASLPSESIGLAIYSPPFATENGGCLYNYSSSVRDLSNARTYAEFFDQYSYIVEHVARVLKPGRISAVHCMDVPKQGANIAGFTDFPGDIIRLHEKLGFEYTPRITIWKEPLEVRNRTMSKALAHRQICEDATKCNVAAADYLIPFRKLGENPEPVTHAHGLLDYAGSEPMPNDLRRFRGHKGNQIENKWSHQIWRRYASSHWLDIRIDRVLPYAESKDEGDERHQHPLQLDVIERAVELWSNPVDAVLTPFMGVGSEVYGAVSLGRRGVGCELKPSYYRQAVKNLASLLVKKERPEERTLFSLTAE
jgi:DNA modification methylase